MSPSFRVDARIAEIAGPTHGAVPRDSLLSGGISRSSIHRRIVDGSMQHLGLGVMLTGHSAVTPSVQTLRVAASLLGGHGGGVSHETAALEHRVWDRPSSDLIDVIVPGARSIRVPEWVRVHRSATLTDSDVEVCDGMSITTIDRTLLDLGKVLTPWQLAAVLRETNFQRRLDLDRIEERLRAQSGSSGTPCMRRAIALHRAGSAGTRSRSEDELLRLILASRLPRPLVNVRGVTGIRDIEPDTCWPRHRLIVEVDGGGHLQPKAAEADASRDAALRAEGWTVHRIPAGRVWRAPRAVAGELARMLTS